MAVYKVPQDVEADDKLIGPFSFRQFIYLIIVAICIALAWGLSRLFPIFAIIPLPFIIFFLALALPLRKDQPMETYLAAVVSFYFLKSRKRLWQPDGIDSFVTIIPPKNAERILTKNLDEEEADKRLSYLAELVDTHGWAVRGEGTPAETSMHKDLYYESQTTEDMFDTTTGSAQAMSQKLTEKANEGRDAAKANMQKVSQVADKRSSNDKATAKTKTEAPEKTPGVDPLENAKTLAENAENQQKTTIEKAGPKNASTTSVSTTKTDTIGLTRQQAEELSQNSDLSVKTLAQQANRMVKKNREALLDGEEVTISLR